MKRLLLLFNTLLVFQSFCFGQVTEKPLWKAIQLKHLNTTFPSYNIFSEAKTKDSSATAYVKHLTLESDGIERFLNDRPQTFTLTVPYKNQLLSFEFMQYEVQTADFEVLDAKTGVKYTAQKGLHYRGVLKNDPLSMAAISVFDNQIMGVFSDVKHGDMVLGKAVDVPSKDQYVFYANQDQTDQPPSFECHTDTKSAVIDPRILPQIQSRTVTGCVRMSLEIDNELYVYNGSSIQNTVNYINGLMNVVYAVYTQEQISMVTSQIFIWTVPDTYVCDTNIKLTSFSNFRSNFNGDLAHLITAEPGGGACGGRAWIGALCGANFRHGVSDILETYSQLPASSYTVNVLSHEIGHNLGSPHTHSCTWVGGPLDNCAPVEDGTCAPGPSAPYTIMSYCPYTALHNGFGTQPGNLIRNRVQTAVCLNASCTNSGCAAPTNFTLSALPNGNSATFTWTAGSGNTAFNLLYRPSGTNNGWTTISNVTSPYTMTVFTPSTTYEVMLNAFCSSTQTDYSVSIIFTSLAGTCIPPNNLTANVTNTNAELNWTENAAATFWEIRYGPSGFNPTTAGTIVLANTKPYTLSNLTLNTSYDWYIRSVCVSGVNGFTPYGGPNTFTTPSNIVYCTANYNSPCLIGDAGGCGMIPVTIRRFQLTKTSNSSTVINNDNNGCLGATSDHTAIVGNVSTGQTYNFAIHLGLSSPQGCYFYAYVGVWIDYNNDGDFLDTGETIFISPDANTFVGSFTIPTNVSGNKRLRIRRSGGPFGSNPACATIGDGEAEDYTLNITGSVIPVELLNFQAKNTEGGNLLMWQTASEVNTSHFDIESSTDGKIFEKIGETKAQGKAAIYNYLDKPPLSIPSTRDYYRLKIHDLDGSYKYSEIISLNIRSQKLNVKVFPNPTRGNLNIDSGDTGNAKIRILNIFGQEVLHKIGQSGQTSIDISHLPNGVYFAEISAKGVSIREKVIKN